VNRRVGRVNRRVGRVNRRVGRVNRRVGRVNRRVGRVNRRVGRVNRRVGRVNRRVGRVNRRVGRVNRRVGRVNLNGVRQRPHLRDPSLKSKVYFVCKRISKIMHGSLNLQAQLAQWAHIIRECTLGTQYGEDKLDIHWAHIGHIGHTLDKR
jgi:hypothetical protein